ncbi:acetate kinase [Sulfurovum sp.]|uniref:acetate/propionate family kinase n=1 Tax=Sulfurovum sp. TaxID=1969726 RepID=UPI0025FA08E6|nr:acetate kinase [Sulfurovum sp.]
MKILVLNAGSSSLKCQYFVDRISIATLLIECIGEKHGHSKLLYQGETISKDHHIPDHEDALKEAFTLLDQYHILPSVNTLDAIGHRVVHGGNLFHQPIHITPKIIEDIRSLIPLAPLHNPANLKGIEILYAHYPYIPQVAVFDTAFHQSMPAHAYLYPLPYSWYEKFDIRRYGFHGISHSFITREAARVMGRESASLNLITLHLGNGASATAIRSGRSIDTSMGMTPLEGLMMGTRCGDIDPAIIPYLSEHCGMDISTIETLLNKKSGLKGICGHNDMREVIKKADDGDALSLLALQMYIYRIRKYIGAYAVVLGQVDALVFTGGIGENAARVREMVCEGLEQSIRLKIDRSKNEKPSTVARSIGHSKSHIQIWVIPTNEELEIVMQLENIV